MRRREFITLLGGIAAAWPLAVHAQTGERVRRIGVLMAYADSDSEAQAWIAAFREGLQKLGWTESRNISLDVRWATGERVAIERFAKELVATGPELILASTTPATAALLQQTRTIPIVFALVSDPVGSGFVVSFPRPGGNVTGFTTMEPTMAGKWLELLKQIAPRVTRVAFLFNPASAPYIDFYLNPFKAAAASFAVDVIAAPVHALAELESIVAAQAREPNGGLLLWSDAFMSAHRAEITSLLVRYRLPAVSPFRIFTEAGALLSYGSDPVDNFRRTASYVDRILKGEKPGDLPVQAPVTFELVINLKAAKSLGLEVPWHLQQRADEDRMMRRREFITLLGGAAVAWPLAARAQQPGMPVIGFLNVGTSQGNARQLAAFRQGLRSTGYIEKQNVVIEYRWAEGQNDRLPALAASLVQRTVTVIASTTTPAALAAKAATDTIPIVFETAGDPIKLGLVASLNRPGHNITGVTQLSSELVAKRVGLLHELIPTATVIGLLSNPTDPRAESQQSDVQKAASGLGMQVHVLNASTEAEIDTAFASLARLRAGALLVGTGELFRRRPEHIATLAARQRVPAIYQYREFVEAGGLMSYGASLINAYRLAGSYVGQILKGVKPSDLPVLQPTKFELLINLEAARMLGLNVPPTVLALTDEVIE